MQLAGSVHHRKDTLDPDAVDEACRQKGFHEIVQINPGFLRHVHWPARVHIAGAPGKLGFCDSKNVLALCRSGFEALVGDPPLFAKPENGLRQTHPANRLQGAGLKLSEPYAHLALATPDDST